MSVLVNDFGLSPVGLFFKGNSLCQGYIQMDITTQKIENIGEVLSETKYNGDCTLMMMHNILEIHWISIPCFKPILDIMSVFCIKGDFTTILKPIDVLPESFGETVHICDNNTFISQIFPCESIETMEYGVNSSLIVKQNLSVTLGNLLPSRSHMKKPDALLFPHEICQIVSEMSNMSDSLALHKLICPTIDIVIASACLSPKSVTDELVIDATGTMEYDQEKNQCIYELDECGQSMPFTNGKHLLNCHSFKCKGRYFSCPEFYCIPWRYVCNSVWDCPGGVDEIKCKRTSCPGFFKCHQSVICPAQNNICDNTTDCKFGDDEYFCQIKIPTCPDNCTCVLYSISCEGFYYSGNTERLPYIHASYSSFLMHLKQNITVRFYGTASKILFQVCLIAQKKR